MRFGVVIALALGWLTSSAVAKKQQTGTGEDINYCLEVITNGTIALNTSITEWDGSLFGAPYIMDISGDVIDMILNGTTWANRAADMNATQATVVYETVLSLTTVINSTLANLDSRRPQFQHWSLDGVIQWTVELTKKRTDILSAAILEKVPDSLQSIAQAAVANIDKLFVDCIAYYNVY